MYIYKLKSGIVLCKSESKVQFNETAFPVFAEIKPETEGKKKTKKEKDNDNK